VKKFLVLLLLVVSTKAFSQFGFSDQYQFNLLAVNPAFTGERGNFGVTAMLGNQFSGGFRPRQVSQIISMDGKIGTGNSSIGFQGFRNTITSTTNNGLNLSYAYSIQTDVARINIGLNAGFSVSPNFVGNQNFTNQISPFAGLGLAAILDNVFVGISSPTLFAKPQFANAISSPLNLMAGYRIGSSENIALNLSALAGLQMKTGSTNFLHINPKVWLGDKIGLGSSFRFHADSGLGILPTAELRVSESSTIGISYDSKPLRLINGNSKFNNPNGLFQLMYRYDVFTSGDNIPIINLF
jgi:type IX secretion system PorP/SprF family membrane protein